MIVLGIDPGQFGGFAGVRRNDDGTLEIAAAIMAPLTLSDKKPMLDVNKLDEWLHQLAPKVGVIEAVHAMPKQGVASSFQFGRMYGAAESLMHSWCDRCVRVTPQKWKKAMGLGSEKIRSIDRATAVFGKDAARLYWPLKKHEGVAEAALIAAWWIGENGK